MIEFISITADPALARRLWALPDNTVMVDLEIAGKRERQSARDTVINFHTIADVKTLAALPDRGPLLVRTNALDLGCFTEIEECLALGVERFMFPMFHSRDEVDRFLEALGGRAAVSLLVETDSAVSNIDSILHQLPLEVDHIHIGLNDLSLERRTRFLFEPVASGEIEQLSDTVRRSHRRFGFGGVGAAGFGEIPGERLLAEHVRVRSAAVILSRTFHSHLDPQEPLALEQAVQELRAWEARSRESTTEQLYANHRWIQQKVSQILDARKTSHQGDAV